MSLDGNHTLCLFYLWLDCCEIFVEHIDIAADFEAKSFVHARSHLLFLATQFLSCVLNQDVNMLRDADGDETLRIVLDTVYVDEERLITSRLHFNAVEYEACLA